MSRMAIIVEYEVASGRLAEFLSRLREDAAATLRDEGCLLSPSTRSSVSGRARKPPILILEHATQAGANAIVAMRYDANDVAARA